MARPLRIEYEGAVYHIISRGNRGDYIFQEDEDKKEFLEIISKAFERFRMILYAWCIMGNHFHLLAGEWGQVLIVVTVSGMSKW